MLKCVLSPVLLQSKVNPSPLKSQLRIEVPLVSCFKQKQQLEFIIES